MTCNVRSQSLSELTLELVPLNTENLDASENNIECIEPNLLERHSKMWNVFISDNLLRRIDFLSVYRCLGVLDLRNNRLQLSDLAYLSHISILHLKIEGNLFQEDPDFDPMWVPAIVKYAWTIDGEFVTDNIRNIAQKIRKSNPMINAFSAGRTVNTLIQPDEEDNLSNTIMSPKGLHVIIQTRAKQIQRLTFLSQSLSNDLILAASTFEECFSLTLGILSHFWLGERLDIIPHLYSPSYFSLIKDDIERLEEWQLNVVLYRLYSSVAPITELEQLLWKSLALNKFIQSGVPPMMGSTSRLLVTSCFARAIVDQEIDSPPLEDMRIYFRYRQSFGFTEMDSSLESVYTEIIAPIPVRKGNLPSPGDKIEVVNPVNDEWVNGYLLSLSHGRLRIQLDNIIVQLPTTSVYWDSRGFWRETAKKVMHKKKVETFITGLNIEEPDKVLTVAQPESPRRKPEVEEQRVERTIFRGIADPPFLPSAAPPPVTSSRSHVADVVNVTRSMVYGRIFHVRMQNDTSGKSSFQAIKETSVTPDDVQKLLDLYRAHISAKLKPKRAPVKKPNPENFERVNLTTPLKN